MKKLVEYTPRYNLYIVLEAALSLKICNTLIPLILDYTSGSLLEDWQQLIGNIIDNRGDPEKELIQSLYRVLGQLDQIPARSEEKVLKNFNYLLSGVIAFNEYGNDKNFIESLPILLRRLNIEDKSRELYKKTLFFLDSAEEFTIDKNEMDLLTHFYRQYHIPFSNHTGIQLVRNVFKYICGQLREITSYDPMMLMLPLNIDYLEEKESKYYFIFHGNNLGLKKNLLENLSTFKQDFITYKNYKDFYKREVLPIIKGLEILPEVLGNIVCSYLTVDLKETSSYMLVLLNTLIKQPNVDVRTLYTILLCLSEEKIWFRNNINRSKIPNNKTLLHFNPVKAIYELKQGHLRVKDIDFLNSLKNGLSSSEVKHMHELETGIELLTDIYLSSVKEDIQATLSNNIFNTDKSQQQSSYSSTPKF